MIDKIGETKLDKEYEIEATDYYGDCLFDSMNQKFVKRRRPQGLVKIYEVGDNGDKKLTHKTNLVVYNGREGLAQRLVNINNPLITASKDEFLTRFGLGDGGVDIADPFVPLAPVISDDTLNSNVMINATDSSNADYHVVSAGYPEEGFYKKPFESVAFEADVLNDNRWIVIRISITIAAADANGSQLSEAGLYTASSGAGGHSGNFSLFSKVTFPTIVKTDARRLVFVWFLFL